ncbi:MAG: hypothetical protein IJG64_03675 [Oscillospiraceae bacterium]|nr:hypothetical protein [Oscillospiraceae bacterium]MBQ6578979.1 hypothetical protein [Bacteroidales bacterium]
MTTAITVIAICSCIRIIQNGIQLFMLIRDSGARDNAYREFVKSLKKTDKQVVREFLREAEEYLKANERKEVL